MKFKSEECRVGVMLRFLEMVNNNKWVYLSISEFNEFNCDRVYRLNIKSGDNNIILHLRVERSTNGDYNNIYILEFDGESFNYISNSIDLDTDYDRELGDSLYCSKVADICRILNIPLEEYFDIPHPDTKPAWLKKIDQ
jgi:hypothetical protein